ncbi:hypothetical protein F9948_11185 [Burkholderia thailandensis]|nr:hypothetical protein [Burkholderia thailandensis]MDD1489252.1 hypothetical protein [Burkholderia thailandensis]MDD1493795.1 hypothetical protein [Burkholderia thailandensis]TGB35201.1 hypothetical protein C6946_02700 [Burkholderia thailandensis]
MPDERDRQPDIVRQDIEARDTLRIGRLDARSRCRRRNRPGRPRRDNAADRGRTRENGRANQRIASVFAREPAGVVDPVCRLGRIAESNAAGCPFADFVRRRRTQVRFVKAWPHGGASDGSRGNRETSGKADPDVRERGA